MQKVSDGSRIKVHYTGKLDNGEVFDTSEGREPIEFTIGAKQVIKGFEENIKGMKLNEEKEFKLEKMDAYGDYNPGLVKEFPKDKLPQNVEPKAGMVLALKSPEGKVYGARIIEVREKTVKIDLNHPLAGKALNFKVKVVEIL